MLRRDHVTQPPRGNPPSVAVQLSDLHVVGHNLAVRRRHRVRILTQKHRVRSRTVTPGTCAVRRVALSHQTRVSAPHAFAVDCTGHDVP